MGKSLFIGCSHSMGFIDPGTSKCIGDFTWQENNYAELYAHHNKKETIIMASAGAGNDLFPRFLAYALKTYNDIDEVFIQSTYWGRFPVAIKPYLDDTVLDLDFFIQKEKSDKLIDRYTLGIYQEEYSEYYHKPDPTDFLTFPYVRETYPMKSDPNIRAIPHLYMQMWHYSNTHLEQYDYFKNILACDSLCNYNNVKLHLWNINERCLIPKETSSFLTNLQSTIIADVDAETYLTQKGYNITKVDTEHYSKNTHEAISKDYLEYVKGLNHA